MDTLSDEVEAYVITLIRYDVVTNYNSLTTPGKKVIGMLGANLHAQKIINYDMSGYTTGSEADQMINILENQINRIETMLKDDKHRKFLGIST